MISYMCIIQTKSVSVIVFEIIAIKTLFDLSRSKVKSSKTFIFSLDISIPVLNDDDINIEKQKFEFLSFKVTKGQGHHKN